MPIVTESMMYTSLSKSIARAEAQVQRSQEQASSGLRVATPDQDPVAAAQSSLYTDSLASLSSMQAAGDAALASLTRTDQILQAAQHLLASAEEISIAAGNTDLYPEQISPLVAATTRLHDELLALANAQENGTYIFSGFSGNAPFAADGTYFGDSNARRVEVSPGLQVPMTLPGSQVFNVAGGQNVLLVLQTLATAIGAHDVPTILDSLQGIQSSITQISSANSQVGVYVNQADGAQQSRNSTEQLLKVDRSKIIEVDMAQSLTDLARSQAAYQAAIMEASKILQELGGGLLR